MKTANKTNTKNKTNIDASNDSNIESMVYWQLLRKISFMEGGLVEYARYSRERMNNLQRILVRHARGTYVDICMAKAYILTKSPLTPIMSTSAPTSTPTSALDTLGI
jgi:hypothetical protein